MIYFYSWVFNVAVSNATLCRFGCLQFLIKVLITSGYIFTNKINIQVNKL